VPKNAKFIIGLGLFIMLLLAGGFVFARFVNYKYAGLAGLQKRPQPTIVISSPQTYDQASVRSPLPVSISAHSYQPIKSLQLWVNGVLMGEEHSLPQNTYAFETAFVWLPGAAGKYSLVARLIDQAGDTADSPVALVEILAYTPPAGAGVETAFDTGQAMVLPSAPAGAAAPVAPPAPGQSSGSGQSSAGASFGDFLNDLTVKTRAAAPGLVASLQGCAVNLQLHDLSNNEEGFQIFRSVDGATGWEKIATLSSQSSLDWISYTDTLTGGTQASYHALAINAAGGSESNLVSVSVNPSGCPAASGPQPLLQVSLQSFDTGGSADRSYCYRSLDDLHWARWPVTGFLASGSDPLNPANTSLAFETTGLGGRPGLTSLELSLECWGWSADALKYLGKVHFSNPDLSKSGPRTAKDGVLSITIDFQLGDVVTYKHPLHPTNANMPFISAWLTYDLNVCKTHLPASAQNDFGAFLFCSPWAGYTIGAGTANPQPYLVWLVLEHTCAAGFNTDCVTLAEIQAEVQQEGGYAEFLLHESTDISSATYGLPLGHTSYVVPMSHCQSDITATIQVHFGTNVYGGASSPESNEVTIPCTQPITDSVPVTVSFDSMKLNNVKDGESAPQDVELYGRFLVTTSSGFNESRNLGNFDYLQRDAINCQDESFGTSLNLQGLQPGKGCLDSYPDGTYSLAEHEMCSSSNSTWYCYFSATDTHTVFKKNNNTIKVPVTDGDQITLKADVWDFDSASADDLVCSSQNITIPRTVIQWASLSPQTISLTSADFGNGSCTIQVTITAAP
jgi:hypothetical protein